MVCVKSHTILPTPPSTNNPYPTPNTHNLQQLPPLSPTDPFQMLKDLTHTITSSLTTLSNTLAT